ncbi:hypothetical protein ACFPPD_06895 [Cohnella suwonensis]|uniref:Uncharacterized protein n=1 Tax=Cohnella suwonensis TaxID=696072 RepID=A0ABW0LUF6_9BACL
MGKAGRRKQAGDTKPKGKAWREYRPSRFVRWLVRRAGQWKPL